jgi:hypothetical protein
MAAQNLERLSRLSDSQCCKTVKTKRTQFALVGEIFFDLSGINGDDQNHNQLPPL